LSNTDYSTVSAVIFGCSGPALTDDERAFFRKVNPYGFILFARNCKSREQIKALVIDLRTCVSHAYAPVLIDQEGGRVARLTPPEWRKAPPAGDFALLAARDLAAAQEAVYLNARLLAADLHELGIDVDCAPVLDVPAPGAHEIIGDRAFGDNPDTIALLAGEMCKGLIDGGVLPVIKHIPGHGRAMADSHESLPVVATPLHHLREIDFAPFHALRAMPYAMTAHVVYTAIDADAPATTSAKAIHLIRDEIGFKGVLISDDLSMKALSGDFSERTRQVLAAGCDVVLHCNGKMDEMQAISTQLKSLSDDSIARIHMADAYRKIPETVPYHETEARLSILLKRLAA